MATFYPRTTRYESGSIYGDIAQLNWYKYVYGTRTFKYPLPNCTIYAYGRIMEQYFQNGYDLSVRTDSYNPYWWNSTGSHFGDAYQWYDSPYMQWERGSTPKLGAIACFEEGDKFAGGHVAIVEGVNSDGTVNLSESAYKGGMFNYRTNVRLVVGQIDSYASAKFKGYIYIPLNYDEPPTPPTPSRSNFFLYRRGKYVKIINYGRASSTGRFPIAKGIGWKKQILRVYENRAYPVQVGDIRTGMTTGFYKYDSLELLN